jgi:hypothetical protein
MPRYKNPVPDGFMNTAAAAAYLGITARALSDKRSRCSGPRYTLEEATPHRALYTKADLDEWLNEQKSKPDLRRKLWTR